MKLASYTIDGEPQIGFALGERLLPSSAAIRMAGVDSAPRDMRTLIELGTAVQPTLTAAFAAAAEVLAEKLPSAVLHSDVCWLPRCVATRFWPSQSITAAWRNWLKVWRRTRHFS